jgi:hypothetical protein
MHDIKTVTAPSLPSGEYRLRTSRPGLVAVAERLVGACPLVASLIDVPSEDDVAAWDRLLETTNDVSDGSSEEEWAALAVPLVNALRIRCQGGSVPGPFRGCLSFLMRCPPAVAWFALRNSMAWESANRATGPSVPWQPIISELFRLDPAWVDLFVQIRKSDAFAA